MKLFSSTVSALLLLTSTLLFITPAIAAQDAAVSLIERYQRAVAIDSHNPTLQYQLGVALLVEGKPHDAIEKFQRAYPAYIDSVELNYNLGLAYFKTEDPDSAVLYFEQAEALGALDQPGRYPLEDAYFNLGLTYLKNDLHREAEQIFHKVMSLDPDRIKVHHALGKLYTLSGQMAKAVAEYDLYLTAQPNDQPVRNFLFASYYNSGLKKLNMNKHAEAREDFAKALKLTPNSTHARYTLAHTDMLQGDPEAAIDKLNNISPNADQQLRQNIRVVMFNSALALLQRQGDGDLIKAEQAIRTLLEETPEDTKALFLSGNISLTRKHYDQARLSYETLLDIDPGHEGMVDKFMGDSVMALFGAPLSLDDDPLRAVSCALEMQQELEELNREHVAKGEPPFQMGIGINTGPVVAGNIGSSIRMKYTVIGDNVNIAARLQGIARSGEILMSEQTRNKVGHRVKAKAMEPVILKGNNIPIGVFLVNGLTEEGKANS